ncbi:Ldh family oxidoreductase [Bradyrhizobium sp. Cp5.3]|uniref:Ldh family oxidoreductase n=1 Tax=Bradyrhizobium sp. Cp5.3 TaxID=443598 RepID=UPI0004040976|nr:Ldh family oxidoreductase [Bradyrhizobium sp. Cp5.3]
MRGYKSRIPNIPAPNFGIVRPVGYGEHFVYRQECKVVEVHVPADNSEGMLVKGMESVRYSPTALRAFASGLFCAAGMDVEKAEAVADILVEADMLGHDTHGLELAARYLSEIEVGSMSLVGEPETISDRGAAIAWNGRRLPGPWLMQRALETAFARVEQHGVISLAIGNGHHIGCQAAYLQRAALRGMVLCIFSSGPGVATVAPFGGTRAALSPAPFAISIPTGRDPVMIDVSASITTNNMAMRLAKEGRRFDESWLMDAEGNFTNDPTVIERGGTILPAGGRDHGQKGYSWALAAEALSQGLSGYGRADGPKGMLNSVFLQLIAPSAFAGLHAFTHQTDAIARSCSTSPARPGMGNVRLPGEAALRRREAAKRDGLQLRTSTVDTLRALATKLDVTMPQSLGE